MRTFYLAAILLLIACAGEVPRSPTTFSSNARPDRVLLIDSAVVLHAASGYSSTMPAKSQWAYVGTVPEGDVFKIKNDVFTVTGRHVHEAFVVVNNGNAVGFYLPVEQAFSPLAQSVRLPIQNKESKQ